MTAPPVLSVRNLSVAYRSRRGRLRALRDVDLEIAPNRILGIVGESGCGKSTLIAAILGLLAPNAEVTSGTIGFAGENLLAAPLARLRAIRGPAIATVFQDPMTSLNPVLSIATQMIDIQHRARETRTEKRARAVAMLERVGIPDATRRIDDYAHRFSGGMRQRIAIALATICRPDFIIADEPTTALDVVVQKSVLVMIRAIQRELGSSLLFVTHDMSVHANLSDRLAIMYAGRLVEEAATVEIFRRPQHPYTAHLVASLPRIGDATIKRGLEGTPPNLAEPPPGCRFHPRCPIAMAVCSQQVPPMESVAPGHRVACFAVGAAR